MEIIRDIPNLRRYIRLIKSRRKSIGFVPTMGALHDGHLELLRQSTSQNDITIASIFVNPTQFNNPLDFNKYPRELESDIPILEQVNCTAAFVPSKDAMYEKQSIVNIDFGYLENIMEGKYRPGHFKGVGLVIVKLFNLVEPNKAYFGTKDLQQLKLINRLTSELLFDVEIIPVKTVRERDGLAMSSRNRLLSKNDRLHAVLLYETLSKAKEKLNRGESVNSVVKYVKTLFDTSSRMELEYFKVVQTSDLESVSVIDRNVDTSLCIAAYLGNVRLIDNISLN